MHPEVRQEGPGRCPKCGMALVPEAEVKAAPKHTMEDRGLGPLTWQSYIPLIVIFGLLLLGSLAASWSPITNGHFVLANSIGYFMAGFFIVFAGFKLMDLKGFAEGYSTYDLLAQRWSGYGYIYPFVELAFGLLMLAGLQSAGLLWAEIVVMRVLNGADQTAQHESFATSLSKAKAASFRPSTVVRYGKMVSARSSMVSPLRIASVAV